MPVKPGQQQQRGSVAVGSSASKQQQQEQITPSPLPILQQHINTAEHRSLVVYKARNWPHLCLQCRGLWQRAESDSTVCRNTSAQTHGSWTVCQRNNQNHDGSWQQFQKMISALIKVWHVEPKQQILCSWHKPEEPVDVVDPQYSTSGRVDPKWHQPCWTVLKCKTLHPAKLSAAS